jgi:hypothetical protein
MTNLARIAIAGTLALLLLAPAASAAEPGDAAAYSGSGAWVDIYTSRALANPEESVMDMSAHGIRTLYLETGNWRLARNRLIAYPDATARFISAAHGAGIRVVAWYLPSFSDRTTDMRRIRAAIDFETEDGQRFDGFALDIEATLIRSIARRNDALLRLSRSMRRFAGSTYTLGAIVPDYVSTTSIGFWPQLPYRALDKLYDVFVPMAYSSLRARGADAVYAYARGNIEHIRFATRNPGARVHLIGGLTNRMSDAEDMAVVEAAKDANATGVSFYKYTLYGEGEWTALSAFAPIA